MSRSKSMYSGKSKATIKNGKRYNPNTSRYKLFVYHILSKISVNKKVKYKNGNINSKNKSIEIGVLNISEEVEREYYTYKIKQENKSKKSRMKFSFYNSDGSLSCIGILLGMCSDEDYIRKKARHLLINNLEKILKSDDFKELISTCFTFGLSFYLITTFFINIPEFIKCYF